MFDFNQEPGESVKIISAGFGRVKYIESGYTVIRLAEIADSDGSVRYELSIFVGGQKQEQLEISRQLFSTLFYSQKTKELYFDRIIFKIKSKFEVLSFYTLDDEGEESWRKNVVSTLSPRKSPPVWLHEGKDITDPLFEYWFFKEINQNAV